MGEGREDEPSQILKRALSPLFIAGSMFSIVWDEAGGNRLLGRGKQFLEGLISSDAKEKTKRRGKKRPQNLP